MTMNKSIAILVTCLSITGYLLAARGSAAATYPAKLQVGAWKMTIEGLKEATASTAKSIQAPQNMRSIILDMNIEATADNQTLCTNNVALSGTAKRKWPLAAICTDITKDYSCLMLDKVEDGSMMELIQAGNTVVSLKQGDDEKTKKPCIVATFKKKETKCHLVFFVAANATSLKYRLNGKSTAILKKK